MYRIKKYPKGWIVEFRVYKIQILFFTFEKWEHITHYSGIEDKPYFYKTPDDAINGALREIKKEMYFSYNN